MPSPGLLARDCFESVDRYFTHNWMGNTMRTGPFCAAVFVACVGGCSSGAEEDRLSQLFSGDMTVIDLTHALNATSPYWPSGRGNPFKHDTLSAHPSGAPSMAAYSTPEHHGTHLDAPIHSAAGQPSVDQLTAADLFGPAVVVDVSAASAADPDYTMTRQDLLDWEEQHGRIPDGAVVLMYTGWSRKWSDYDAYKNQDEDGRMHFPGFSEEAARFLVEEREINGIGIDNLSVDAAVGPGFPAHGIVNGAGKFHLENVANVHLLPPSGAYLIVAPIKIEGGSGGQVRIFAVVP